MTTTQALTKKQAAAAMPVRLRPGTSPFYRQGTFGMMTGSTSGSPESWLETETVPPVNVIEQKDRFIAEIAVPGLNREDLNVSIEGNFITVSCDTEQVNTTELFYNCREWNYSSFLRTFPLPESANTNPNSISASYINGILSLVFYKKSDVHSGTPQRVAVS